MNPLPPYMIIIESCVAGAVVAYVMTMTFHLFIMRERSKQLKEEDDTDEATATVLVKDTEVRSRSGGEHENQVVEIYKVTYEFSAEKADGTPCMVRVFGREIDFEAWKRLDEGGTVQVLYLAGRPGSCRMKDMVEIEASSLSNMLLIA